MDVRKIIPDCHLGRKYLCYGNDTISITLEEFKHWEAPLTNMAEEYLNDDSVILDIGANIGVWSVTLAKANRKIHSFEPFKSSYMALCGNIFLNKVENNIDVYNCALTDDVTSNYELVLEEDYNIGGVKLSPCTSLDKKSPNLQTIDSLNLDKLDFIKIDVEGHEYKTLKGGERTILKFKPVIFFECWIADHFKIEREQLMSYISSLGYDIYSLSFNGNYMDDFKAIPKV